MFAEVFNRAHKLIGYFYLCDGCGCKSRITKNNDMPENWKQIGEREYSESGLPTRKKRIATIMNNYCPSCQENGVSAETTAAAQRLQRVKRLGKFSKK